MRSLWWQGATSLCVHPGSQPLVGWSEIEQSWSSIFRNTESLEIDLEVIQARGRSLFGIRSSQRDCFAGEPR